MEEKNELNDIILNKSGSGSKSKKLLLAIAALTLILIIVLVIMNSLKSESNEQPPHAAMPPEPSAPTEIIDDPLFEPVEVIQEGNNAGNGEDLGKIAQKIKQESFDNTPAQEAQAPAPAVTVPKVETKPVQPAAPVVSVPKAEPKPAPKPVQTAPKPAPAVVNTPTIKSVKPAVTKPAVVAEAPKTVQKPAVKAAVPAAKEADTSGTYYIQVGSFAKEPSQALFDRIKASGMKYTTVPSGSATKVLVGPFEGKKSATDSIGSVRKNIEANAFVVKG